MAVVTISREIGSMGSVIGKKIAEKMDYFYVDKQVMERVFEAYTVTPFEQVYESSPGFWSRFDLMRNRALEFLNNVIKALARQDRVVLVGRGGFAVLAGYAEVLNVRIQAPFHDRVQRVMAADNLSNLEATESILNATDQDRIAFVESTYQVNWDMASNFDLVIDTGKINPDMAVDFVCDVLLSLDRNKPDDWESITTIEVDPGLDKAAAGVMGRTTG